MRPICPLVAQTDSSSVATTWNFAHGIVLALLAAVAVDLGFGVAFINDVVAYLIAVYMCLLLAILVGRSGPSHWSRRVVYRLPIAVTTAMVVTASLRSWALFEIPIGQYTTTGHSPYVVLPVCALISVTAYELLGRAGFWGRGLRRAPVVDPRAGGDPAEPAE